MDPNDLGPELRHYHFTDPGRQDEGFWATHEEQGDRAMLELHVGKAVEITHEERRQLEEHARMMMLTAKDGRAGWLLKYAQAHRGANQIFRRIMERAHT